MEIRESVADDVGESAVAVAQHVHHDPSLTQLMLNSASAHFGPPPSCPPRPTPELIGRPCGRQRRLAPNAGPDPDPDPGMPPELVRMLRTLAPTDQLRTLVDAEIRSDTGYGAVCCRP